MLKGIFFLTISMLMGILSCSTTEPRTRIILVDFQTYTEWGTTKLIPIGRRPIPSQKDICLNPIWMESEHCKSWIERHRNELQR